MSEWYLLGARVFNRCSKRLIVAYNHPKKENQWAFSYLEPGKDTPFNLDIDGVKAADPNLRIAHEGNLSKFGPPPIHGGWWKIRNGQRVTIKDRWADALVMTESSDIAFGLITWAWAPAKMQDKDYDWSPGVEMLPMP
jgi:hypothetical protein